MLYRYTAGGRDNEDMAIGPNLRKAREQAGLSQPRAAQLLGFSGKSTLSAYERGQNVPPSDALAQMADLYQTTADFLLGREDKMRPDWQGVTREHTDFLTDLAQLPEEVQEQIMSLVRSLHGPLRGAKMVADLLSVDPRGADYEDLERRIEEAQREYRRITRK